MAAKKEVAKKKTTAKKSTNTKKVVKVSNENINSAVLIPENVLEEQVKEFNEALKDGTAQAVKLTHELEIENGDPSVLTPKEETNVEAKEEPVKEKKKQNKITKKTNQFFGYFWNGLTMD